MENNVNLTIDQILNKEFSIDFKGYSAVEVDQFLDTIGKDYETFLNTISQLQDKINKFEEKEEFLKTRIVELENKLRAADEAAANSISTPIVNNLGQVDILRRIARLEQEVFNRK